MIKTEATEFIEARPEEVWDFMSEASQHWVESNPEHEAFIIFSDREDLREGVKYEEIETIGGIPSRKIGEIKNADEPNEWSWQAEAVYRLGPLKVDVQEGGTFTLEEKADGTQVTHKVWGKFPDTWWGEVAEWIAKNIIRIEERGARHAKIELEYFKKMLEG